MLHQIGPNHQECTKTTNLTRSAINQQTSILETTHTGSRPSRTPHPPTRRQHHPQHDMARYDTPQHDIPQHDTTRTTTASRKDLPYTTPSRVVLLRLRLSPCAHAALLGTFPERALARRRSVSFFAFFDHRSPSHSSFRSDHL